MKLKYNSVGNRSAGGRDFTHSLVDDFIGEPARRGLLFTVEDFQALVDDQLGERAPDDVGSKEATAHTEGSGESCSK
jgi:hypothetical protein